MKNCKGCKYADWQRTAAGKLHPSGDGRCKYPWKMPLLPASMYWLGSARPSGGRISRRENFEDHCPYYTRDNP